MAARVKRSKTEYPTVITATLDPTALGGSVRDLDARVHLYETTLRRYICETKMNPIIYIENSGYPFDYDGFRDLAAAHGKRIEFLTGSRPVEETQKHGKGYGDALLVQEALEQSAEMKNQTFFYKISGRLPIENIDKVYRSCGRHRNEFISYDGIGWVMTWIFKMNKEDYWRLMRDVYLRCDDKSVRDMEICYWLRLIHSDADVGCFRTYPRMFGYIGETNQPYVDSRFEFTLRNIGSHLGIFTMKSLPSRLFWKLFMKVSGRKPYVTADDDV